MEGRYAHISEIVYLWFSINGSLGHRSAGDTRLRGMRRLPVEAAFGAFQEGSERRRVAEERLKTRLSGRCVGLYAVACP